MASEAPLPLRLRVLSDEAMRTLPWLDLAAYVDALNEEYQRFSWLISQREIGAHVPIAQRPKKPRRGV